MFRNSVVLLTRSSFTYPHVCKSNFNLEWVACLSIWQFIWRALTVKLPLPSVLVWFIPNCYYFFLSPMESVEFIPFYCWCLMTLSFRLCMYWDIPGAENERLVFVFQKVSVLSQSIAGLSLKAVDTIGNYLKQLLA